MNLNLTAAKIDGNSQAGPVVEFNAGVGLDRD
jgi:hypothetical protein